MLLSEEDILKSNKFEKCHTWVLHTINTPIYSTLTMDKTELQSKVSDNFCCKGTCLTCFSNLFYHRSSLLFLDVSNGLWEILISNRYEEKEQ